MSTHPPSICCRQKARATGGTERGEQSTAQNSVCWRVEIRESLPEKPPYWNRVENSKGFAMGATKRLHKWRLCHPFGRELAVKNVEPFANNGVNIRTPSGLLSRGNHCVQTFGDEHRFSEREISCVFLYAAGLSDKEIATQLEIATSTVRNYLHRAVLKAGCDNRDQLRGKLFCFSCRG